MPSPRSAHGKAEACQVDDIWLRLDMMKRVQELLWVCGPKTISGHNATAEQRALLISMANIVQETLRNARGDVANSN